MKLYTLGFAFNILLGNVVLIQKRRPAFQHGKWNGIGGGIDEIDYAGIPADNHELASVRAMVREFKEETSATTSISQWTHYIDMLCEGKWHVSCYFTILSDEQIMNIKTAEDQHVVVVPIDKLPMSCMRNVPALISFALNWDADLVQMVYSENHFKGWEQN